LIYIHKFILTLIFSFCFMETGTDLSTRITIDGLSDDFTSDEEILSDAMGNPLESSTDSYWGEYNDVKQIRATWDETYLYIAVDACSWDNNLMLFIDVYDSYGIEDMSEVTAWQRSFKFYNFNPDYFVGTWDTNDSPQFWRVQQGGSIQVELDQSIETYSTLNTGSLGRSMEVKIPWTSLIVDEEPITSIKLLSLITSGDDYTSSPDCAPDNLGGMTNNSSQMVVIDNFAEILIDGDGDGNPDMGVSPQAQTEFYKTPPFDPLALLIQGVIFENGKSFSPSLGEKIYFELETNRGTEFNVKIFDVSGKFIDNADSDSGPLNWSWDGKNKRGNVSPFGVYILYFIADSGELSHKEAVVLIK